MKKTIILSIFLISFFLFSGCVNVNIDSNVLSTPGLGSSPDEEQQTGSIFPNIFPEQKTTSTTTDPLTPATPQTASGAATPTPSAASSASAGSATPTPMGTYASSADGNGEISFRLPAPVPDSARPTRPLPPGTSDVTRIPTTSDANEELTDSCTDPDDGFSYFEATTVTEIVDGVVSYGHDYCEPGETTVLVERYCALDLMGRHSCDCADSGMICVDGACVEDPDADGTDTVDTLESSCDDPDGGFSYFEMTMVSETIDGATRYARDYCESADSTFLVEIYCALGEMGTHRFDCAAEDMICSDGACVEADADTDDTADTTPDGDSPVAPVTRPNFCTDPDDGFDYFAATTVSQLIDGVMRHGVDHCEDGSNVLVENYCVSTAMHASRYDCGRSDMICVDGACVEDPDAGADAADVIESSCDDPDGGFSYFAATVVVETIGTVIRHGIDHCEGNVLVENYCALDSMGTHRYDCASAGMICSGGACVEAPVDDTPADYYCEDGDGGIDYSVQSTVTEHEGDTFNTYTDRCLFGDLLIEYSCEGARMDLTHYNCASTDLTCVDGACVEPAADTGDADAADPAPEIAAGTIALFFGASANPITEDYTAVIGGSVVSVDWETESVGLFRYLPETADVAVLEQGTSTSYSEFEYFAYTVDGRLFSIRKWASGRLDIKEFNPATALQIGSTISSLDATSIAVIGDKLYYNTAINEPYPGYISDHGELKVLDLDEGASSSETLLTYNGFAGSSVARGRLYAAGDTLMSVTAEYYAPGYSALDIRRHNLTTGAITVLHNDLIVDNDVSNNIYASETGLFILREYDTGEVDVFQYPSDGADYVGLLRLTLDGGENHVFVAEHNGIIAFFARSNVDGTQKISSMATYNPATETFTGVDIVPFEPNTSFYGSNASHSAGDYMYGIPFILID